jgi:RimJ/RimL family protein N-acetyltransferase
VVCLELLVEKIILKPYTMERCHEFHKDYVSDPAMTEEIYIYDKDKVDAFYKNKVLEMNRRFFAICLNNKTIGEIQLKRIDFEKLCGTLSVALSNDTYKGKGYGTQAQRLLINHATDNLGLKAIYADAVHRNHRSKHILEKLGFKHLYNDNVLAYFKLSIG